MSREQAQHLHSGGELDQEFRVAVEMMDLGRTSAGEARHRLAALPIGDSHELGIGRRVLAKRLHTKRLFNEWLDAGLAIVGFVGVSFFGQGSAAPGACDGRGVGHGNKTCKGWTGSRPTRKTAARPADRVILSLAAAPAAAGATAAATTASACAG